MCAHKRVLCADVEPQNSRISDQQGFTSSITEKSTATMPYRCSDAVMHHGPPPPPPLDEKNSLSFFIFHLRYGGWMPYSHSDQRHRVHFRQHKAADTPLPCFVIGIVHRVSWDYRWKPLAIRKVHRSRLCGEKKTAPGTTLVCTSCFTKAFLRYPGVETPRRRGYNHSRNKASHAVVGRLQSPLQGSRFRGGGLGNF